MNDVMRYYLPSFSTLRKMSEIYMISPSDKGPNPQFSKLRGCYPKFDKLGGTYLAPKSILPPILCILS